MDATIREYLEFNAQVGRATRAKPENADWKYLSYAELVLDLGVAFAPTEYDPKGTPKECFKNALMCSLFPVDKREQIYVEGWAYTHTLALPLEHAWMADDQGNAYDPTWSNGAHYLGVPLEPGWVMAQCMDSGSYGLFGNDWKLDCRLLREGIPPDAIPEQYRS